MVMYGTSVRVGTVGRYVPIGNSRHGACFQLGRTSDYAASIQWMDPFFPPARACASVKDKTFRWMAFKRGRRREASAGFSRDSRKSFDGVGQGWCATGTGTDEGKLARGMDGMKPQIAAASSPPPGTNGWNVGGLLIRGPSAWN